MIALACVALGALSLLWPGDAPWIFDEPRFFHKALQGIGAAFGLPGTRGFDMGPFAVWFYGVLLGLTRDLPLIVTIRAALFAAAAIVSLLWLARSCEDLRPAFAPLALCSFYLFFYSRILWDTFYFPLSALCIASYVSFCVKREGWKLWITTLAGVCLVLTHLMGLVVTLPIAAHFLWLHWRWLVERPKLLCALAAAKLALIAPYAFHLITTPRYSIDMPSYSAWKGFLFPLFGCRLFSAQGLDYFLGDQWKSGAAAAVTVVAYPLAWAGMALCVRTLIEGIGDSKKCDGDFHMAGLALASLATQCVVFGIMRAYEHPHYLGPGWLFSFYFIWTALSEASRRWGAWADTLAGVYGVSLTAVLVGTIVTLHHDGGNRSMHYGETLGNQIEVARALQAYTPGPIDIQVRHDQVVPEALTTLMEVYGLKTEAGAPSRKLAIVYDGQGGRIKLVARD